MSRAFRRSDHFDGRRFFNPTGPQPQPFTKVPQLMLERGARWPAWIDEPTVPSPALGDATAVVTLVGHSTFLIQTPLGHAITDPMFSTHAGPFNRFGPRRVRRPAIALADLPPIAVILLSHNHYDHCDLPSLRALARRFDPLVVTLAGNAPLVRKAGIRKIEELDWWDAASTAPFGIMATPAHHFSARTPFDRNRALWGGFALTVRERRIYFAGDTAYAGFFPEVRQRCGPFDLALIPIGAYEPRWFMRPVHMNPDEAVQAHLHLDPALSIGMHYGTFQLTTEPIDEPVRALERALLERNVPEGRFRTIGFGESVTLD